jgi:hypothetical protein
MNPEKKKKWYVVAALATIAFLGFVFWLAIPTGRHGPMYEGKPLEHWVLGYRSPEREWRTRGVQITRQAGTNALPTLVRMLDAHDPALKRSVMTFLQTRSGYRIRYISSDIINCAAANACRDLGGQAQAATPALLRLLKSEDAYVREAAREALERISPASLTNVQNL